MGKCTQSMNKLQEKWKEDVAIETDIGNDLLKTRALLNHSLSETYFKNSFSQEIETEKAQDVIKELGELLTIRDEKSKNLTIRVTKSERQRYSESLKVKSISAKISNFIFVKRLE